MSSAIKIISLSDVRCQDRVLILCNYVVRKFIFCYKLCAFKIKMSPMRLSPTMVSGSIVKIETEKLFDDRTKRRNKAPFVYGVLTCVEEEDLEARRKAWNVHWALNHLKISMVTYNHLCCVLESDLKLVLLPNMNNIDLDEVYSTSDFFHMDDGKWEVNDYVAFCEYCSSEDCDRMKWWDLLDYDYETMFDDEEKDNAHKRVFMYRSFLYEKYGYLGKGNRSMIPHCVACYCTEMFPPPDEN